MKKLLNTKASAEGLLQLLSILIKFHLELICRALGHLVAHYKLKMVWLCAVVPVTGSSLQGSELPSHLSFLIVMICKLAHEVSGTAPELQAEMVLKCFAGLQPELASSVL